MRLFKVRPPQDTATMWGCSLGEKDNKFNRTEPLRGRIIKMVSSHRDREINRRLFYFLHYCCLYWLDSPYEPFFFYFKNASQPIIWRELRTSPPLTRHQCVWVSGMRARAPARTASKYWFLMNNPASGAIKNALWLFQRCLVGADKASAAITKEKYVSRNVFDLDHQNRRPGGQAANVPEKEMYPLVLSHVLVSIYVWSYSEIHLIESLQPFLKTHQSSNIT